ncbi:MAG: F0F1 ATP synthase subunit epsilon [Clostridia bacterium]|nr:F0F1 ATP synthase subunit epsilon [Clostridia bacterium]
MREFRLRVLSPDRVFYDGPCLSLTLPLEDGSYGVQAGHAPLTAAIVPGEATFLTPEGERMVCALSQGMVNVGREGVLLLCESVLAPEEIDEEAARREAQLAAEDMKGKQSYRDYMLSQLVFARAVNNLRVKKHDAARINQQ